MLLASAALILPVILGEDSGVICGQTNGELGSQLHSLKPGGLYVQGGEVFQLVQSTVPAEDWSCVSQICACSRHAFCGLNTPSDFYSL